MLRTIGGEQDMEIVAGRFGVAHLELNGLAFLDQIPDGDCSSLLVGSDQIPHQKIAALEAAAMFIDGDADMQGSVRVPTAGPFQRLKDFLKPGERRFTSKLEDRVLFGTCHHVPFADRTTALRDHGSYGDGSAQLYSNDASLIDVPVLEEPIVSRPATASGQAADRFGVGISVCHGR
jgi:hypothetical protein